MKVLSFFLARLKRKRTALILLLLWFSVNGSAAQDFENILLNRGELFTEASILQDFDGDGDPDILITRRGSPAGLEWLENKGTGQFPRQEFYTDESLARPRDIDACDCDNDGDVDYVIAETSSGTELGQLFWLERQDDGTFIKWTIEAGADFDQVDLADFNDDGNEDIVAVGFDLSTVNLYLNDGALNFTKKEIAEEVVQIELVEADDIDDDGDVDIIFEGFLLRNNGDATFEDGEMLYTWSDMHNSFASGLAVADLNGDGTKDILTFSGVGTGGLYFLDGSDGFDQTLIDRFEIDIGGDLIVADIDGNGMNDIIRQHYVEDVLSILYQDSEMTFRNEVLDLNWDNRGPSQMSLGDLDGDGDLDLVFPGNGNVNGDLSWFENIEGSLYRHQLYAEVLDARIPKITDLDGDGDLDIVLTVTEDIVGEHEIIWYENRGEDGFVDWRIADSLNYPADVEVADLDGDDALDIVATARDDNDLVWFRSVGPDWEMHVIEENANSPLGLTISDIDSDGDIDVVLASSADAKVYWYENDGTGSFTRRVVDANLSEPREIEAVDLDLDDDTDIVVITTDDAGTVSVYINDGEENFARQIIGTDAVAKDVELGDWNGDGSPDILVSYETSQNDQPDVDLFTNDGFGAFSRTPLITESGSVEGLRLVDFDGDGDLDLAYGKDASSPLRLGMNDGGNLGTPVELLEGINGIVPGIDVGDVNGDGRIDLVATETRGNNVWLLLGSGDPTSVERIEVEIPDAFSLSQNYPNPFNPSTTIRIDVSVASRVQLEIFDVLGRRVATLVDGWMEPGAYQVEWDGVGDSGATLSGGTYIYRITAGQYAHSKAMTLIK